MMRSAQRSTSTATSGDCTEGFNATISLNLNQTVSECSHLTPDRLKNRKIPLSLSRKKIVITPIVDSVDFTEDLVREVRHSVDVEDP
ncbi:hypothetical protein EVAR_36237_1 [Eumeta japonica]|uniref:Uncharacterized protein n=1 Tax=Eumeta variegata TaxID=151549 RepID=A0A4C1WZK4_EUMVA|nr:hypothetical protein EVAR_36237_1 [Eumeta japonica]